MYSKSIHGNKLNFIEWFQYLHIFVNEKIADNNIYPPYKKSNIIEMMVIFPYGQYVIFV